MSGHTCQSKIFTDYQTYVCGKKAGHEHEGCWFCKTHHPPTVKEKQAAKRAKWEVEWNDRIAQEKQAKEKKEELERKAAMFEELLEALGQTLNAMIHLELSDSSKIEWEASKAAAYAAIAKATGGAA